MASSSCSGSLAAICDKNFFKEYTHKIFEDEFVSLTKTVLEEKIPEYTEKIEKSATMNALRWLDNADRFSLKTEAETVSNYIDNHTDFLFENWLLGKEYCQIGFLNLDNVLFFTVQKGGKISQLPNIEDTENAKFIGFYYADSNEKFDITRPINSNIEVYAKWDYNLNKTENRIIKYSPIAIIAVFFIVIFIIDIKRNKWKR